MNQRPIGRSDLNVSPLCFGGNVFGWTLDEKASFAMLDAWLDHGFNFIDTADVYSRWAPGNEGGESETIIGKWFAASGKRDRVVLATKCGMDMGGGRKGLGADYIVRAVEDSLRRLQTDVIDLYQSHKDDEDTPQEETLEAHARLVQQGKVRVIGASNFSAARLRSALSVSESNGWPRYECLQPLYNMMERDFEAELAPLCEQEQIAVIPYYSLASGFLSGKYRSEADAAKSVRGPRIVEQYLTERGRRVLAALDEIAAARSTTLTALALAWLMAKPAVTAPIVSATSPDQLAQVVAAADIALTVDEMQALDGASA
jgi:aryl-alcohol dehydrogenase-like predicted oxidoreductase